jgi:hypothetical protein
MAEMAKARELGVYEYLKYLLDYWPNENMTGEQLGHLATGSEETQNASKKVG